MKDTELAALDEITPFLLDPQNIKQVAARPVEKSKGGKEIHQADAERLEPYLAKPKEERQCLITQRREEF